MKGHEDSGLTWDEDFCLYELYVVLLGGLCGKAGKKGSKG